jgi:hypothetical protein
MSKVARRLVVSLIIAGIMIVSFASAAFAEGNQLRNSSYDGSCETCDGDGPSWLPEQ